MTLLIVNDETIIADTMKEDMKWTDYGIDEVYTAYDVCSAKEKIENTDIDILLCDIEMPGENGLALLRWVRANGKEMECIFLTCHAKFVYAQEAMSLNCQDYILTPAKYEDIGKVIQNVVERIENRREGKLYMEYGKNFLKEKERNDQENGDSAKWKPEQMVEMVTEYIMKNITKADLNVENIASCFHFHPVYLNRIFRKEKNVSISQFIIKERMKMAALLLKQGNSNVTEVAEKVGYIHYTNFYNMFRKTYQISPVQYVDRYGKNKNI